MGRHSIAVDFKTEVFFIRYGILSDMKGHMHIRLLVGILLCGIAPYAFAQAPFGNRGTAESQEVYHPPEVFTLNAKITKQEGRKVEGIATFWNTEDAIIGGLTYKMELIGKLDTPNTKDPVVADNAPLYDSVFAKDMFTLIGKEKREIPFTYSAPARLPAREYRLEITVATTRGRTMGWYDVPVTFSDGSSAIIDMRPAYIIVPEYKKPDFEPGSGPNVTAGKSITITAQASSSVSVSAIPVFDIYQFNNAREKVATIRGNTLRIDRQVQSFALSFPSQKTAGVYVGILSLRDSKTNEQLSNIGEYRYVVRGSDADILHLKMNADGFTKGSTLRSVIDFAGAADAETVTDATVTVEVVDAKGVAGSMAPEQVTLTDKIGTGTSNIVLQRDVDSDFHIVIRISKKDGTEIVRSEIPFSFTPAQQKKLDAARVFSRIIVGMGVVIIIGGGVLIWKSHKKSKKKI